MYENKHSVETGPSVKKRTVQKWIKTGSLHRRICHGNVCRWDIAWEKSGKQCFRLHCQPKC